MTQINVVIVDDEAHCRYNLSESITSYPNWNLVKEFTNACDLLATDLTTVDVIFLDIAMPKMSGIEAARKLQQRDKSPIIVFVSAFDHYAVEAFEICALDYLLKPFDSDRFNKTAQRVADLLLDDRHYTEKMSVFSKQTYLNTIVIKSMTSIKGIDVSTIHFLKSSGNYVEITHQSGTDLLRSSLTSVYEYLDPKMFCQIHRQYVIKTQLAKEINTIDDGKYILKLSTGKELPVGSHYRNSFIDQWLH